MMNIVIGKKVILSVVVMMIVDFVIYYVRVDWLSVVNLAVVACYALYINRVIVKEMLAIIRERFEGEKK